MPEIQGKVEFRNVTFGYEPNKPVLKQLNFEVKPGEMIGLVGHSGAGKSTTINLLCRFYDVDEGEILIDGVPLRQIRLENLRSQIGIVPQDMFLFSGTIAENISYAKPSATREEIIRAAKIANAHDFILRKADGYETTLGEGGGGLSAGEKQRIAIARAVLHNPRILILDEATSQMDVETEKQIQEAIAELVKGRTTIAIAHRLSTLKNADRLIVLKEGGIVEMGSHEELLSKEGEFHRLVQMYQEVAKVRAVER
jgi:ATP-binding cassette subfamily B protein